MDGPSVAVAAVFLLCAIFFAVGVLGLWLTSRRHGRELRIGRWWCARCRVVWKGSTPAHGGHPRHTCGHMMIPTPGDVDEMY